MDVGTQVSGLNSSNAAVVVFMIFSKLMRKTVKHSPYILTLVKIP